jgi:hypothetical protein
LIFLYRHSSEGRARSEAILPVEGEGINIPDLGIAASKLMDIAAKLGN